MGIFRTPAPASTASAASVGRSLITLLDNLGSLVVGLL